MKTTLVALALSALPTSVLAQTDNRDGEFTAVASIPTAFQGRWAQLDVNGTAKADACQKTFRADDELLSGPISADLVVGSTWLYFSRGHVFATAIEQSADGWVRMQAVSHEVDGITVDPNLLYLSNDGRQLEIASSPEIGWELAKYARCPDDVSDRR